MVYRTELAKKPKTANMDLAFTLTDSSDIIHFEKNKRIRVQ